MTIAAGLLLTAPAAALADSATLSVTTAGGESDPVADVSRVFTLTGATAVQETVFVEYRPVGGAPCAATADSDSGRILGDEFWDETVNGAFTQREALIWSQPGTFLFCTWLAPDSTTVTTPISQTITFRAPTGTITAAINPVIPRPRQRIDVTVTGSSEAQREVFATVRRAGGAACAPTYESDPGESLISGEDVNGAFTIRTSLTEAKAGGYVICLWLASSSEDTNPIAGPQPQPFSVVAPPPACRVPGYGSRRFSTLKRKLRAGHCTLGRIRYAHSSRIRRGRVIRLSPAPGKRLRNLAPVNVVISSGPRRHHRHRS